LLLVIGYWVERNEIRDCGKRLIIGNIPNSVKVQPLIHEGTKNEYEGFRCQMTKEGR